MKGCLPIFLLLVGCGLFHKNRPSVPTADSDLVLLEKQYALKLTELASLSDANGWPEPTDCDLTLWAGEACYAKAPVKISLAEYSPGEIGRRPAPNCGPGNGSASTISNDMLTGYMLCLWGLQDLGAMQRLANYGEAHSWTMGSPATQPEVHLSPDGYGILGRMIFSASKGKDVRPYRIVVPLYLPVLKDYEKHLMVDGIMLEGAVAGSINDEELKRLKELVQDEPGDPLKQAALGTYLGDQGAAIKLLLDPKTPDPSYVRGNPKTAYSIIHWLMSARIVLGSFHTVD